MEPAVELAFLERPADAGDAHVLILPGTKQTLDDLAWLRRTGFAEAVLSFGGPILGVCGGLQMLGETVDDPQGVENAGRARKESGLGLLPLATVMEGEKVTRPASGTCEWGAYTGYEIHMGRTTGRFEGAGGRVRGTYIHGLFDSDALRHEFVRRMCAQCGLPPAGTFANVAAERDGRLNRLAEHVRASLDMRMIRNWIGIS
jgi:adenosylcobyric acid synthase